MGRVIAEMQQARLCSVFVRCATHAVCPDSSSQAAPHPQAAPCTHMHPCVQAARPWAHQTTLPAATGPVPVPQQQPEPALQPAARQAPAAYPAPPAAARQRGAPALQPGTAPVTGAGSSTGETGTSTQLAGRSQDTGTITEPAGSSSEASLVQLQDAGVGPISSVVHASQGQVAAAAIPGRPKADAGSVPQPARQRSDLKLDRLDSASAGSAAIDAADASCQCELADSARLEEPEDAVNGPAAPEQQGLAASSSDSSSSSAGAPDAAAAPVLPPRMFAPAPGEHSLVLLALSCLTAASSAIACDIEPFEPRCCWHSCSLGSTPAAFHDCISP